MNGLERFNSTDTDPIVSDAEDYKLDGYDSAVSDGMDDYFFSAKELMDPKSEETHQTLHCTTYL